MKIKLKNRHASPRSNVVVKLLLLIVISIFTSTCSIKRSDIDQLKSENDSLMQLLAKTDLDGRSTHDQSKAYIRNSLIHELTSKYTRETYDVYISYPDNYENSAKKYPVLVVLDAEVNFGAVSYIVQRLIKDELIPALFVVGIAYQGDTDEDTYYSLRSRDFTPTTDKGQEQRHKDKFGAGTGGAENFVKFLSLELFPYLNRSYPIGNTGNSIYGHSFGGLFGAHVFLNHPELFDNYLLLSPSLWWDQKRILKDVKLPSSVSSKQIKLYVATGGLEGNMVGDHLEMVDILKRFNADNIMVKSEILDHETHRSIFGRGFTNGLRFLYAKSPD